MLIIKVGNISAPDAQGRPSTISSYDVRILVNTTVIAAGIIHGHDRRNGWRALLTQIATSGDIQDRETRIPL